MKVKVKVKVKVTTNQLVIGVAELDILQIDAMQELVSHIFKKFCLKVSKVTSV